MTRLGPGASRQAPARRRQWPVGRRDHARAGPRPREASRSPVDASNWSKRTRPARGVGPYNVMAVAALALLWFHPTSIGGPSTDRETLAVTPASSRTRCRRHGHAELPRSGQLRSRGKGSTRKACLRKLGRRKSESDDLQPQTRIGDMGQGLLRGLSTRGCLHDRDRDRLVRPLSRSYSKYYGTLISRAGAAMPAIASGPPGSSPIRRRCARANEVNRMKRRMNGIEIDVSVP